jgi:hypothetical protein
MCVYFWKDSQQTFIDLSLGAACLGAMFCVTFLHRNIIFTIHDSHRVARSTPLRVTTIVQTTLHLHIERRGESLLNASALAVPEQSMSQYTCWNDAVHSTFCIDKHH